MSTIVLWWSLFCAALMLVLLARSKQMGRPRAASWLVVLGATLLTMEEPALTLWISLQDSTADRDGMSNLITSQAQAHVIDAAVWALGLYVVVVWVACTALRRGERWAQRVLVGIYLVIASSEIATTLFVFSRGLAIPGPGGRAGAGAFGWQPLAVGLLSWGIGLVLVRDAARAQATHAQDGQTPSPAAGAGSFGGGA